MARKPNQTTSLEHNLNELKKIVEQMEQKNLSLEDSLAHFEQGIQLVRESKKMLSDAEQKISILLCKDDKEQLIPFEEDKS